MRKNMWPDGETMPVQCPRCDALNDVQIVVVREDDGPCRPDTCSACHADFEVQPDGKAFLLRSAKDRNGFPISVHAEQENVSAQTIEQHQVTAFNTQREPFKALVLKHITGSLPADEWDQMRKRAAEGKPFDPGFKFDATLTAQSFVHSGLSEDGMSVNDALIPAFRKRAIIIGMLLEQPVYYVQGSGIYVWGIAPDSHPVYMLWLSHPVYPPGW